MNITEATRKELIDKSKSADIVKSYGETRYERRLKQHVINSIAIFNMLDMNALFKADVLSFIVPVEGESDDYMVKVIFDKVCEKIKDELRFNNNQLEYKVIYRAIVNAINQQNIRVSCDCPDFKYRLAYQATQGDFNSGQPENRPARITNPNDSDGAGCKHILNVLGNLDWALKLATSIYNYIKYMEDNYPDKFERIIFPRIFPISYSEYTNTEEDFEEPVEEPTEEEPTEEPTEEPEVEEA
jgi:hypothetical protein